MKYKRLSIEELSALEKDFIQFLASAQITGADWEKMKKEEPDKADELIDVFSDVVYDKVLSKINYLEHRETKSLNVFCFEEDRVRLVGLRVKEKSSLDLTAENVLAQWNETTANSVTAVSSEKKYGVDKQTEIFEMLQTGCLITDDRLFKAISAML